MVQQRRAPAGLPSSQDTWFFGLPRWFPSHVPSELMQRLADF